MHHSHSQGAAPPRQTRRHSVRVLVVATLGLVGLMVFLAKADDGCRTIGIWHLEQRQHERALSWLQWAAWLNLQHPDTQFQLARVHRRLGQFDQFRHHWHAARRLGWDADRLQREQWIARAQTRQFQEMRQHWAVLFEHAGSDGPEISEGFVTECLAKFHLNAAGLVLDAWQQDFPSDAGPYYLRGLVREASKNWVAAEQQFQQTLDRAPAHTEARHRLATALIRQLRFQDAVEHLRQCLQQRPADGPSSVALAECLHRLGQTAQARRVLHARLDADAWDDAALRKLGEIELAVGRLAESLDALKRAAQLDPVNQDLRYQLATVLRQGGNPEAARHEFDYVSEASKPVQQLGRQVPDLLTAPDDIELRFQVAMTTWKFKSRDDGARWFHSVLEFDPQHGPTHQALAQHYAITGDRRRAAYHRRLAESLLAQDPATYPSESLDEHWTRVLALNQRTMEHGRIVRTRWEPEDLAAGQPKPSADSTDNSAASAAAGVHFVEKTKEAGIDFTPTNGVEWNHRSILETLGVGIAVFDYDGDGLLDIFCPGGGNFGEAETILGRHPVLYRNEGDWRFTDVTTAAGLRDDTLYSHGAIVADFDNDGFPDILITGYGGLRLFHNQGDGTFREMSQEAGLTLESWSTSAAWGDLNGDGILDLYVVNYVDWSFENNPDCSSFAGGPRDVCSPTRFNALPDMLYFGNGDGTFRDESARLTEAGKGLGVIMADLDLDAALDVYVANDTTPNLLFQNDGNGNLTELGLMSGTALNDTGRADGSMGVALGDFDLDGLPDLWVSNFEDQSFALYRNEGNGVFHHVSGIRGITQVGAVFVGFGTVWFDLDGDGYEDIFVTNGHVMHESRNAPFLQKPLLFRNLGGKRFVNVAPHAGNYMSSPHMGRGVAVGDLDGDGRLDLAVSHTNQPIAVLANQSEPRSNWLVVRLIGVTSNRSAIGTRVIMHTDRQQQTRQVIGGGSYLSTSDKRLHFGLGETSIVQRLDIHWPSGITQHLEQIPANQIVVIHEPALPDG